jgi:EmrB/QacA subfamily drug resistance transporter
MPVLIAISLAQVVVVVDVYSLTVALPRMADDLGVTTTDLQWVITAYMLAFASLMVVGGRIGDVFGRRRTLVAGLVVFGAGSALCGLAPGAEWIVAFRVLQGVGGALLVPTSLAALAAAVPEQRRSWTIGVVMGVASVGNAIGPFVGGALTGSLGWRWVFLVNVPLVVAAVALTLYALDESRDEQAPRRLDLAGCGLLAAGIVAATLGIDRAPEWGLGQTAATLGGAALLLTAFVLVERRAAAPIVDLGLFRGRAFREVLIAGCLDNYGWAVTVFGVTIYLQQVEGLSPLEAGTAFIAMSVGSAVGGPLAGRLVQAMPARAVMLAALAVGAGGLAWLSTGPTLIPFLGALLATGLGVGLAYSTATIATIAAVPPEHAGAAAGMTLTALVMTAALAVTSAGTLIEALSHGGGGAPEADAIGQVLRIGALAAVLGAALLLPSVLRRRAPAGAPALPEGSRAYAPAAASSREK